MSGVLQALRAFESHSDTGRAYELLEAGQYDEAQRTAAELLGQFPSVPGIGLMFARIHMQAGNWQDVEAWAGRTIEMADQTVNALNRELQSLPVESATDAVEQCAAYRAEELEVLRQRDLSQFGLALVRAKQGDESSATVLLEEFVAQRPDSVFLRVRLAEICHGMDRIEDARRICRACLDIDALGALPGEWEDLAELCDALGLEDECRIFASRPKTPGNASDQ